MDNILLSNGIEMPPIVETTNWMDYPVMKKLVTAGLIYYLDSIVIKIVRGLALMMNLILGF